jgi:uncharacterized protein YeeX (DUF496 family)
MIKVVHWKQVRGNPFTQPLHPRMLSEDGYQTVRYVKLTGNDQSVREKVRVTYKRDYAVAWLATYVFSKLQSSSIDDIIELIRESHESWQDYIEGVKEA